MTDIPPHQCNEVRLLIVKEKQQLKQSKQESITTPNQLSCKKLFMIIITNIIAYVVGCEMCSFALKTSTTCTTDITLNQYRMLNAFVMMMVACFCFAYNIFWYLLGIFNTPKFETLNRTKTYSAREDEATSMAWHKQEQLAKIIACICMIVIWFAMFGIAHLIYLDFQYIQDKSGWDRSVVYFYTSVVSFGLCSVMVFRVSRAIIVFSILTKKSADLVEVR